MFACDHLLIHATTLDLAGHERKHQALAVLGDKIVWHGGMDELPCDFQLQSKHIEDCHDELITPGFIDCHTHLVYAGQRADEFKLRMQGVSYAQVARSGGGILSTVAKLRTTSEEVLLEQSLPRLLALKQEGVTTVEIKSGYGLDLHNERKMLRVAKQIGQIANMRVRTTFLGAHALPNEYASRSQAYVDYLCNEVLPCLVEEQLVDAVDVFCETIAFSIEQTAQVFQTAKQFDLPIKCHAEQLSNMGATRLATQFQALSCDHLEFLDEAGARAMADANTTAVLLPGAYYFLRETRKPPIDLLRKHGVGMALATDCNPGSSPTTSLLLMLNMGCQLFSLTVPEALSGVTHQAAKALGLSHQLGSLDVGMSADLVHWSVQDSAELCYYFGHCKPHKTMIAGKWSS